MATFTESVNLAVAGPGALLVAKVHKIVERVQRGRPGRPPTEAATTRAVIAGDVSALLPAP